MTADYEPPLPRADITGRVEAIMHMTAEDASIGLQGLLDVIRNPMDYIAIVGCFAIHAGSDLRHINHADARNGYFALHVETSDSPLAATAGQCITAAANEDTGTMFALLLAHAHDQQRSQELMEWITRLSWELHRTYCPEVPR